MTLKVVYMSAGDKEAKELLGLKGNGFMESIYALEEAVEDGLNHVKVAILKESNEVLSLCLYSIENGLMEVIYLETNENKIGKGHSTNLMSSIIMECLPSTVSGCTSEDIRAIYFWESFGKKVGTFKFLLPRENDSEGEAVPFIIRIN